MTLHKITSLAILTTALTLLSGASNHSATSSQTDGYPFTVGVVLPLTGSQAMFGNEAMSGIDIAMESLKSQDPKLPEKFRMIKLDGKASPTEAAQVAETAFTQERAGVILGSISTSTTEAMAAVARRSKRAMIAPLTPNLALGGEEYVFSSALLEPSQGAALAHFALNNLQKKSAAIITTGGQEGKGTFSARFEEVFLAGGGKVVAKERLKSTDKTAKKIQNVKKSGAEVILLAAVGEEALEIMKSLKANKVKSVILGGDGWDSASFVKSLIEAGMTGHYYVSHFSVDDPDPVTQTFVTSFKSKYQRVPGSIAALSYDAIMLISDAVKRSHSPSSSQFLKSLSQTTDFKGVTGSLSITPHGETIKTAIITEVSPSGPKFFGRVEGVVKEMSAPSGSNSAK